MKLILQLGRKSCLTKYFSYKNGENIHVSKFNCVQNIDHVTETELSANICRFLIVLIFNSLFVKVCKNLSIGMGRPEQKEQTQIRPGGYKTFFICLS